MRRTGSFTLAGAKGAEQFTQEVDKSTSVWARGGGMSGMFTGMTGAIGAFSTGGWKGGLMSMANTALSFLPPGMAQAAQAALAAFSAVWKAIKKPSEAELKARKDVDDYEKSFIENLDPAQLQEAMDAGWESWEDAAFLIGIRDQYLEVGKSAAQAEADVKKYWDAIEKGDMETIDSMQDKWDEMGVSIDEVGAAVEAAWQKSSSAAVSGFETSEGCRRESIPRKYTIFVSST